MADKKVIPKLISVKPTQIFPNDWNPNRMNEETFAKEKLSIETHGFIDPVLVREVAGPDGKVQLEIVDGEHRWRVAVQLKLKDIPAVNLGDITEEQAKKLTIIANELRGSPEPALLAALLKDLNTTIDTAQLALELPMSQVEIDSLIKGAATFDWAAVSEGLQTGTDSPSGQTHKDTETENPDNRPFRIGQVKGELPPLLSDALAAEYERSAAACGSRTPEVVLGHWLARLRKTSEETDEAIAALPPVQPARKKRAKKDEAAA
jgi:ParB/RepB/Spo0J family partition protein